MGQESAADQSPNAEEIAKERAKALRIDAAKDKFLKATDDPSKRQKLGEVFDRIVKKNNELTPEDMDLWAEQNRYLKVPNSFWHDSKNKLRGFEASDAEKALLPEGNLDQFRQILVEQDAAQDGRTRTALLVEFLYSPPQSDAEIKQLADFTDIAKRAGEKIPRYEYYIGIRNSLRRNEKERVLETLTRELEQQTQSSDNPLSTPEQLPASLDELLSSSAKEIKAGGDFYCSLTNEQMERIIEGLSRKLLIKREDILTLTSPKASVEMKPKSGKLTIKTQVLYGDKKPNLTIAINLREHPDFDGIVELNGKPEIDGGFWANHFAKDKLDAVSREINAKLSYPHNLNSAMQDYLSPLLKTQGVDLEDVRLYLKDGKLDMGLSGTPSSPASKSTAGGERPPALDDRFLDAARKLFVTEKGASASFLQRRLGIGYNRAAQLFEFLQKEAGQKASSETEARAPIDPPSYLHDYQYQVITKKEGPTIGLNTKELAETFQKATNYFLSKNNVKDIVTEVSTEIKDDGAIFLTYKYKNRDLVFLLEVEKSTCFPVSLKPAEGASVPDEISQALINLSKLIFDYFADQLKSKGINLKNADLTIYGKPAFPPTIAYLHLFGESSPFQATKPTESSKPPAQQNLSLEEQLLKLFEENLPAKAESPKPLPGMEKLLEKRRAGQPIIEQDIIDGIETYAKSTGRPAAYNYFPYDRANLQTKTNFWPSFAELVATNEKAALDSNLVGRMLESGVKLEYVREALTKGVAMSSEAWWDIETSYLRPSYTMGGYFEIEGSSIFKYIFVLQNKLYDGDPVRIIKVLYNLYSGEENKKNFAKNLGYVPKISPVLDKFESKLTDPVIQEALLASNDLTEFEERLKRLAEQAGQTAGVGISSSPPAPWAGLRLPFKETILQYPTPPATEKRTEPEPEKVLDGMEKIADKLRRGDEITAGNIEGALTRARNREIETKGASAIKELPAKDFAYLDQQTPELRRKLAEVISKNRKAAENVHDCLLFLNEGMNPESIKDAFANGINMQETTVDDFCKNWYKDKVKKEDREWVKYRFAIIFGVGDISSLARTVEQKGRFSEAMKKDLEAKILASPKFKVEVETLRKAGKSDEEILANLLEKGQPQGTPHYDV